MWRRRIRPLFCAPVWTSCPLGRNRGRMWVLRVVLEGSLGLHRHCDERSDEATQETMPEKANKPGLLRYAR
ncbi:hypothetical protein WDZ92_49760, partial [Nostoc sp. NIES-2111]